MVDHSKLFVSLFDDFIMNKRLVTANAKDFIVVFRFHLAKSFLPLILLQLIIVNSLGIIGILIFIIGVIFLIIDVSLLR